MTHSMPYAWPWGMVGTALVAVALAASALAVSKEEPAELVAVTRADDARVAAFTAPTAENLDAIFSADLHYAHSTGDVDTRDSFIEVLTTGRNRYLAIDYAKREFTFPAPGIALMTGRARIQTRSAAGANDNMLSFLAVWRLEEGRWRFLAWQSCRLPPPAPAP